jgi:hypothetical protein
MVFAGTETVLKQLPDNVAVPIAVVILASCVGLALYWERHPPREPTTSVSP